MARFVFLEDWMGAPVAVNPDHVTEIHTRVQDSKKRVDILLVNSNPGDDNTVLTVRGDFHEIVRRLSGDPTPRLHPSILVDDQPPAWAPQSPHTDGGAS